MGQAQEVSASEVASRARALFPFFQTPESEWAFFENAGGSQVPQSVVDAVSNYFVSSYAQLGAGYPLSNRATSIVDEAHKFVRDILFNGNGVGECMLGHSTSMLLQMMGTAYESIVTKDDEIIAMDMAHESNFGPWERLAKATGAKLLKWMPDRSDKSFSSTLPGLESILSPRTKIVAITHVSNVLGEIVDVQGAVALARKIAGPRVRIIVDGVAYAPHRAIDVQRLGVDFYVFSLYKVYGPHMAALFGTHAAFKELEGRGLNHFFVPHDAVPYKWELGGVCHEGCAAVMGIASYLGDLIGKDKGAKVTRQDAKRAFELMAAAEEPLQARLLGYLSKKHGVQLIGPVDATNGKRVPTISFVHETKLPKDIVAGLHQAKIACRNGHMYARRLMDHVYPDHSQSAMRENPLREADGGVVRLSLVHYNTMDEVDRCIAALDRILE